MLYDIRDLRSATTAIPAIVEMHRRDANISGPEPASHYEWWAAGGPWMEASLCRTHFASFIANDGLICVARRDSSLAGEIEFRAVRDGGEVYISQLMVDAEYRGQGTGTLLMSRVEEYANAISADSISVIPETGARAFYARNGFQRSDLRYAISGNAAAPERVQVVEVDERDSKLLSTLPGLQIGSIQPPEQELYSLSVMLKFQNFPSVKLPRLWSLKGRNAWIVLRPPVVQSGYTQIFAEGEIDLETVLRLAPSLCASTGHSRWRTYARDHEIRTAGAPAHDFLEIWKKAIRP